MRNFWSRGVGEQNSLFQLFKIFSLKKYKKIIIVEHVIMVSQTRDCSFLPNNLNKITIGTSVNAIRTVPTTEASPKFP